jgi:GT2 family glycosyltransferase
MKNILDKSRLIPWAVEVWLAKRMVSFLSSYERLFYPRLLAQKRAARGALSQARDTQARKQFVFWVHCPPERNDLLAQTLLSLAAQPDRNWRVRLPNQAKSLRSDRLDINELPVVFSGDMQITSSLELERGLQDDADLDCFLYAGDELEPDFLPLIEHYFQRYQQARLIYFDEDKSFPGSHQTTQPWLKPDWSPELLYSRNPLQRAVLSRPFLKQILHSWSKETGAGFRFGNGWEELWDQLAYTVAETAGKYNSPLQSSDLQEIVHIPEILCHTAATIEPDIRRRALGLQAHLIRRGIHSPEVLSIPNGLTRVHWPVTDCLVSIIIPNRDHFEDLYRCINSLYAVTSGPAFEVILVDNHSTDSQAIEYYQQLESSKKARILSGGNDFNFSTFCNLGARNARGDLLLFLNNDVEIIEPEWLHELVQFANLPEIGMVGGCLLYPDRTIQHAGIIIGLEGHAGHVFQGQPLDTFGPFGSPQWYRNYLAVTGACMCLRKEVFEQVGGFDEAYRLVFSDVELGLRITRAGFRVVYNPYARLIHFEGKSRLKQIPVEDIRLGCRHLEDIVACGDPYFNPGLSHLVPLPALLNPIIERESPKERLKKIEQWYG